MKRVCEWDERRCGETSDGSGSKIIDPGLVSQRFRIELGKFSPKIQNFSIFLLQIKKKYLRIGSKSIRSKMGRVGSGPISSGKPVLAFQMKKRINNELIIGRTAAIYIGETRWPIRAISKLILGLILPCTEMLSL